MSQAGLNSTGSSGPTTITINGDVGTATGSTFNFLAKPNCGGTVLFTASTPNVNLSVTDSVHNTTIGLNSGISITTGSHNTALGQNTFIDLTTGESNVAFGDFTCFSIRDGTGNCALGTVALENLISGDYNIAVGTSSGANYGTTESSNIVIGNIGVSSESNVIRIGTQGTAPQEQNACYIAGIVGVTVSNAELVTINSATGQLGVTSVPSASVQQVTVDGAQIIIPSGSPSNITLTGSTVANGTNSKPLYILKNGASSAAVSIQLSTAASSSVIANAGLASFNSTQFTVDSNGFVSTNGNTVGWVQISASQTLVKDTGYFCISPGGGLSLALPTTASSTIGDIIQVTLDGATSWTITQAVGQQIRFSSAQTTSGVGGSLASTAAGDTVTMVYQTSGKWNVINAIGNLTVT